MKALELKIPPLGVLGVALFLMWTSHFYLPLTSLTPSLRIILSTIFLSVGMVGVVASALQFKKSKTTVNPMKPESSTNLITKGLFKYSRNPVYLSFIFILISWGIYLSSMFTLMMIPIFIWYMNCFQIFPEERELEKIFSDEYTAYRNDVRRWI